MKLRKELGGLQFVVISVIAVLGQEPPPLKWELPITSICDSSPAVAEDGTSYFGTFSGELWAVESSGQKKWVFTAGNEIQSSPAVAKDGSIYFGCRDRRFYALSPGGKLKWTHQTGAWVDASPAIGSDGAVFFGSRDNLFYSVDPQGRERWRFQTRGPIDSSAIIGKDGVVYFGSHDGRLYALSLNGEKLWDFNTGAAILSSPAVDASGRIYFSSVNGFLYALDRSGRELWKLKTGGITGGSPVVGLDGKILLPVNEEIWAVTPQGKKAWYRGTGPIRCSPAISADGTVLFFFENGQMVGCDHDLSGPQWIQSVPYGAGSSINLAADRIYVLSGRVLQTYEWKRPLAATPWPKFRGNARNTGNQADTPP